MEGTTINLNKVKILVDKEWAEVMKNKLVVATMAGLPLLFVAIPLGFLFFTGRDTSPIKGMEDIMKAPAFAGMDPKAAAQILLVQQFMFYFLMMPLIIPIYIAAYSIIGEKQQRSLEPLLATPITITELLVSKALAALIPAVGVTWFSYVLYVLIARFITLERVFRYIVDPAWILAIVIIGPLFGLMSVFVGIIVSSRVNDVRLAEQIGGLIVVPFALIGIPLTAAKILVSMPMFVAGAVIVAAIDAVILYIGVRIFQRETILTRWK